MDRSEETSNSLAGNGSNGRNAAGQGPTAGMLTDSPSVLKMATPLVISFWMRAAFTLVDTIYASKCGATPAASDSAVASIGLTLPYEYLMIALWVGLSTGLTSALSRAMGERAGGKIEQYLKSSWTLVWCLSPIFILIAIGIWFAAPHMGLDPLLARNFQIYGATLVGGSAFTMFWSVIPDSVVKAHHDTRSTMWAGIWSNLINVGLNTVFVFGFHWGVFGIALSTVIGRIGGLVYALDRASRHEAKRKAGGGYDTTTLDHRPYRAILGLAIPSAITFSLMACEAGIVNWLLHRLDHPTEALAGFSIFYRVSLFMFQPVIAIAVAMLPYMARRYGERDFAGMRRGLREAGLASAAYAVFFVGPIALLAAPWVAGSLSQSPVTVEYATFALRLIPLVCLFGAPFLLCRPVFESMQRGGPGLAMAALRYGILTLPATWAGMAVAQAFGYPAIDGIVFGLIATGATVSAIFLLWLRVAMPKPEAPAVPDAA
jgi:Na+-driven multidrug efflux pump